MKAIRVSEFGPPEVLKIADVPEPVPGPGQVVVGIKAAGVNPVDAYVRSGAYARKPELPYTPGSDAAGVVEKVGPGVGKPAPGDRVYTSGTVTGAYAERALCAVAQVHRLADGLTFAQGAAVNIPYATAYRALFQVAKAVPGESVLIHGATGGVGIAAVQLARAAGMVVIGTGGTEKGRALVMEQGAHFTLDHGKPDHLAGLGFLTADRGVDIIIEMLANKNLEQDLKALAARGRLVIVGSRGRVEIDPRDIMSREAMVGGTLLFKMTECEEASLRAALSAGLENGTLKPFVGQEFRLADAPSAHSRIMAGGAYGKIVLIP
jgi:NADPH2:quinone reductase